MAAASTTESKAEHGADKVLVKGLNKPPADERRVKIPDPVVPVVLEFKAEKPKEAKTKPAPVAADVHVPASHVIGELTRNRDAQRLYRLEALARNDADVKWLLEQHSKLSEKKK